MPLSICGRAQKSFSIGSKGNDSLVLGWPTVITYNIHSGEKLGIERT